MNYLKQCANVAAVIEQAKKIPNTKILADNYEKTGHPSCFNAIMTNAPAALWLTYHNGP